jgi:hypothetical protein
MGIPCITISGKSSNESDGYHAWNEVYIEGNWYMVDFTRIIGKNSLKDADAFLSREDFKRMGYTWSRMDEERLINLKYPRLCSTIING